MNKRVLTSVAMLEAIWETKRKDLIDLITPFVYYIIAKKYSTGSKIDLYDAV